jgi:serine protease Do
MVRHSVFARRRFRRAIVLVWILAGALFLARSAAAQVDEPEVSAAEREKLYQQLASESQHLQAQANVLRKAVQLAKPTVVHIDSEHADPQARYGRKPVEEAGSGTIIEHKGKFYVLTNRHVVKGAAAESIKIKLADGREISPTKMFADSATDIAVLSVDAPRLVAAKIGNSDDLEIGDFVLAVGSPFGLSHSVTFGIISAKGRRDLELGESVRFQDFMQTDAAINPGNSGGPLLNLKGEVIGMNTAIASSSGGSEGIGFTIPINMVKIIADQLIERGSVIRAYLGVKLDGKFDAAAATKLGLTRPWGAHVSGITENSPAAAAKLQPDDVILEFNGVPIENDSHLMNLVSLTEVGKDIPVTVFRGRQSLKMTVKVGDRATFEKPSDTAAADKN